MLSLNEKFGFFVLGFLAFFSYPLSMEFAGIHDFSVSFLPLLK